MKNSIAENFVSNRHHYEVKAIEALIAHLRIARAGDFAIEAEHVPVGLKNFDYLLAPITGGRKLAVEIFRIVDNEADMKNEFLRGVHWSALKQELKRIGVEGVLVRTPWSIHLGPRQTEQVAAPVLADRIKQALDAAPSDVEIVVDGHEVVRMPQLGGLVVPSAHSGVHMVDSNALVEKLMAVLEAKSTQLPVLGAERILLGVECFTSLNKTTAANGLAKRFDLERLSNVDRVFFMDHNSTISDVYSRSVREFVDGVSDWPAHDAELANIYVSIRLGMKDRVTFGQVRATASSYRNALDFLTVDAKVSLANFGSQLLETKRVADALWIVRQLQHDADPPIEERPQSGGICTVRGTTAWLTHNLAAEADFAGLYEVLKIADSFARDPNPYIREMASFALRVLMARRDGVSGGSFSMPEDLRSKVKGIWRDYVDAVSDQDIADAAASTIDFIFDLSSIEVVEVLDRLIVHVGHDGMRHLARMAMYFIAIRESENAPLNSFDASAIRNRVGELVSSNAGFRGEVSFVLFRSMKDHPESRRALSGYVAMLFENGPEDRSTGFAIECMSMLAHDGLLDAETEQAAFDCLARPIDLPPHEMFDIALRLGRACSDLVAAGKSELVTKWFGMLRRDELREYVNPKLPSPIA